MKTMTKHIYAALIGAAVLSSCSRPVAYFQRGPVENYHTPTAATATVNTPAASPAVALAAPASEVATPVTTPTEQVAQARKTVDQIDAYVRNDNKLASNNKLTKRIERVKSMLNATMAKASLAPNASASTKKMSLLERMTTKKLNKKINNKLSPDQTTATSRLTIGLIVAAAGLLLLLIGNGFGAVVGGIALVVGIVLIILELMRS